jgi:AbrB family looped-hinge helix DNA binding protein
MSAISRKNQITIPAEAMRAAGLHPGDDVRVESVGPGRIELVRTESLIDRNAGSLGDCRPSASPSSSGPRVSLLRPIVRRRSGR